MTTALAPTDGAPVRPAFSRPRFFHYCKKTAKRTVGLALAAYFIPAIFAVYVVLGLLDVLRNRGMGWSTLDRYFAGNGFFTWMLSPVNLLLDVVSLPYRNKGIYQLGDLPQAHQDEIKTIIDTAHRSNLVAKLAAKLGENKRGMMFFKWYGKNVQASVEVPDFHREFKHVRTIGISIFNRRQSTGRHFGPLRITLRVLYNINAIESANAYIEVGNHINRWRDNQLFIFDDTLQHLSCNHSDEVRYCMFVDILRPSPFPRLLSAVLACVRTLIAPVNFAFYKHWAFIK